MDDRFEWKSSRGRFHGVTERNRTHAAQFAKRLPPAAFLDRAGYTLRDQPPPRNDVSIPCVDNDVDVLVEQVSINDGHMHVVRVSFGVGKRRKI